MKLRSYQSQMVDAIRQRWATGQRRVLGCLPTGGGKTEVAIQIILDEATPTNRVLILVERKVLCKQWVKRLRRHGHGHVGLAGDQDHAGAFIRARQGLHQPDAVQARHAHIGNDAGIFRAVDGFDMIRMALQRRRKLQELHRSLE